MVAYTVLLAIGNYYSSDPPPPVLSHIAEESLMKNTVSAAAMFAALSISPASLLPILIKIFSPDFFGDQEQDDLIK